MKTSFSSLLILVLFISCSSGKTKIIHVKPVLCYKYPCVTTVNAGVLEHPAGVDNPLNWYLLEKGKNKFPGKDRNQLKQLDFPLLNLLPENKENKIITLQTSQKLFIKNQLSRQNKTFSREKIVLSLDGSGSDGHNQILRTIVKKYKSPLVSSCNLALPASQEYLLSFYYKFGSEKISSKLKQGQNLKKQGYLKYEFPLLDAKKPFFVINKFPQTRQKLWLALFRCLFPLAVNQGRENILTYLRYKGVNAFVTGNQISLDSGYAIYFILPQQKIIYKIPPVHPAVLLFFLQRKGLITYPQMYRTWEEMLQEGISPSRFARRKDKIMKLKIVKNSQFFRD